MAKLQTAASLEFGMLLLLLCSIRCSIQLTCNRLVNPTFGSDDFECAKSSPRYQSIVCPVKQGYCLLKISDLPGFHSQLLCFQRRRYYDQATVMGSEKHKKSHKRKHSGDSDNDTSADSGVAPHMQRIPEAYLYAD